MYNGVIRIYQGEPSADDVVAEIGFSIDDIKDVTQFIHRAIQTLKSYDAMPDALISDELRVKK